MEGEEMLTDLHQVSDFDVIEPINLQTKIKSWHCI